MTWKLVEYFKVFLDSGSSPNSIIMTADVLKKETANVNQYRQGGGGAADKRANLAIDSYQYKLVNEAYGSTTNSVKYKKNYGSTLLLLPGEELVLEQGNVYSFEASRNNWDTPFNLYSKPVNPANGKIKDMKQGAQISFASKEWTLLDPSSGYIYPNAPIVARAFDGNGLTAFNLAKSNNIAYYLNTTFYNTLTNAEKSAIRTHDWGVGALSSEEIGYMGNKPPTLSIAQMKSKENSVVVSAKIGLLSPSEWLSVSTHHNVSGGFIPHSSERMTWLRNPLEHPSVTDRVCTIYYHGQHTYFNANETNVYVRPALYLDPNLSIVNGEIVYNAAPTLTLNTPNNATLYENDTFPIDGSAKDTDNGDALTVKYQIDSGTVRNLASAISDGVNPISFAKNLTYSEGVLKDGNTVLTSVLAEGTPHTVSVWTEDSNGGQSNIITRTFYVVPNRPPTLTIDPIAAQSNLINSNVIPISGRADDKDKNDVTVTFQINDSEAQHVFTGPPAAFTFNVMLKDLRTGPNTVIIKVIDIYNAETSKVLTINKTHNAVPVNQAVALYNINPPTGSASEILIWIERMIGDLAITVEVSMTNEGEPENFVTLPRNNTGPKNNGLQEDEFIYDAGAAKTNIIIKIIYNRTSSAAVQAIKKISGVLD